MRTEIPDEQLFMAHPSSSGTVSLFSHCTQGSAEACAKTLLRVFIAVALKKEIKHLYFCSVQHEETKAGKAASLPRNTDLMKLIYFIYYNVILEC